MKSSELLQQMDQEEFSLEALRSAVKDRGAKWEPAITSLSMLMAEKASRLGLIPTSEELGLVTQLVLEKPVENQKPIRRARRASNPVSIGLPSKIDWRNVNGVNWTSPMRDQDGYGSFVAGRGIIEMK